MSRLLFVISAVVAVNASQCGQNCGISGHDQVGGKVIAGLSPQITTRSNSECCGLCLNHTQCTAWVRQPSTMHCWLIEASEANKTISRDDRTVGFVQPPPPKPYPVVVKLEAFGANSIRVRVSAPGMHKVEEPVISALLPQSLDSEQNDSSDDPTNLVHGNLKISVDPKFHHITATRVSDGAVLLEQTGLSFGQATPGSRPGSVSATVTFKGTDGEKMYGFGEHRTGKVQQMPYRKQFSDSLYYGKSRGSDVSIPFYTSSKGYGFLWNLPSFGHVDASSAKIEWNSLACRGVDMWITTTPAPQQDGHRDEEHSPTVSSYGHLLHQYADAVGHPVPLPDWASGFIQCKDRYRNQSQLLSVAKGYKARNLPISMIVIDWFHWEQMGDWALNPACWPDPQAMVDELASLDIKLMITFWPFVGMNVSTNWAEYRDKGFLLVNASSGRPDSFWRYNTPTGNAVVDSTNPTALKATYAHWHDGYGKYGVRAMWMDESEPDHAIDITGGQWRLHKGIDAEVLPAWVYEWTAGFADEMKRLSTPPGEWFLLSRNAWAGTASHGAALWSGDISSTWGELAIQVKVGQGVGMSGIPLWTTDIGGYSGGDPSSPSFQRLIVRWFQFGAFSPLFRLHGHRRCEGSECGGGQCGPTNGDNEVWNLAKDPGHYAAIEAVMNLRESLRPYVMAINQESVTRGWPMMRPMFFEFPQDPTCAPGSTSPPLDVEAQFMFGSDWLVAPVTADNATSWPVYLPSLDGGSWLYHWNQSVVQGGEWVHVDVSNMTEFPLFRRMNATAM